MPVCNALLAFGQERYDEVSRNLYYHNNTNLIVVCTCVCVCESGAKNFSLSGDEL